VPITQEERCQFLIKTAANTKEGNLHSCVGVMSKLRAGRHSQ